MKKSLIGAALLILGVMAYMSKGKIVESVYKLSGFISGVSQRLVERMAYAIMDWEDGVKDAQLTRGTIAGENNNPGNMKYFGDLDRMPWNGFMGIDQYNHAVFNTPQDGWNALIHQLNISFNGKSHNFNPQMNLFDFFGKWAEDNSGSYAKSVASNLGVSPYQTLEAINKFYSEMEFHPPSNDIGV